MTHRDKTGKTDLKHFFIPSLTAEQRAYSVTYNILLDDCNNLTLQNFYHSFNPFCCCCSIPYPPSYLHNIYNKVSPRLWKHF